MKILFTICGRAGSKGFKNKNLKEMNGIPLVYYTLAAIKLYCDSHKTDDVVVAVNTDSEQLIDVIKLPECMDVSFIDRKPELAGDKVAKVDVIRDTYREMGCEYDVVVDLDITSPLRSLSNIESLLDVYGSDDSLELVTSVVEARRNPYFNMVESRDGYYHKVCESKLTARQDAPDIYELNASIYAYRPTFLDKDITDTILDHRCGVSVMKDYLVLDIDSEENFRMMEFLHRHFIENDHGLREVYDTAKSFCV